MTVALPEPRLNPDLLGQEVAQAALLRAYRSGRWPHAWLLTGRYGLGKATLAFRVARFLLSGGGVDFALPADHPIVRQVAAGAHPDLVVVEPKSPGKSERRVRVEIDVERIRDAVDRLHRTGVGPTRVLIVDQAHLMNNNAANALLKTLEEPRPGVVLLLTADATHRFPPTIGSRVAKLRLTEVPKPRVSAWLHAHRGVSPDRAAVIAELAKGSPGLASWFVGVDADDHYGALVAALASDDGEAEVARLADGLDGVLRAGDVQLTVDLVACLVRRAVGHRFGEPLTPICTGEAAVLARLGGRLDRL